MRAPALALVLLVAAVGCAKPPEEAPPPTIDDVIAEFENSGSPVIAAAMRRLKTELGESSRDEWAGDDPNRRMLYDALYEPDYGKLIEWSQVIATLGTNDPERVAAALGHDRIGVRMLAIAAVPHMKDRSAVLEPLIQRLAEPALATRAAQALLRVGQDAVAPLRGALSTGNEDVRLWAARILLTRDDGIAPDRLEAMLDDPSPDVRVMAATKFAIGKQFPERCVPVLLRGLSSERPEVLTLAATAIGQYSDQAEGAVARLIELLEHNHLDVRAGAALSLSGLGPTVVPALVGALADPRPRVRFYCAQALGHLGAPEAVDGLIKLLKDPDTSVAKAVIDLQAKDPAKVITNRRLQEEYRGLSAMAALSLARIGAKAERAVPALIDALAKGNEFVRIYAAGALGRIGVKSGRVQAALKKACMDVNESVRKAANTSLQGLAGAD